MPPPSVELVARPRPLPRQPETAPGPLQRRRSVAAATHTHTHTHTVPESPRRPPDGTRSDAAHSARHRLLNIISPSFGGIVERAYFFRVTLGSPSRLLWRRRSDRSGTVTSSNLRRGYCYVGTRVTVPGKTWRFQSIIKLFCVEVAAGMCQLLCTSTVSFRDAIRSGGLLRLPRVHRMPRRRCVSTGPHLFSLL